MQDKTHSDEMNCEALVACWETAAGNPCSDALLAKLLAGLRMDWPVESAMVVGLDEATKSMVCRAHASVSEVPCEESKARSCTESRWNELVRWATSGETLRQEGPKRTGKLAWLTPAEFGGETLAIPLRSTHPSKTGVPMGALVLAIEHGRSIARDRTEGVVRWSLPIAQSLQHSFEVMWQRKDGDTVAGASGESKFLRERIVGAEAGLRTVMERVQIVAESDMPVLILGDTGTGKEVVARAIHARSTRAAAPFLRVNCGAIPTELIDSQLFGHERGSFTGASDQRKGWFERADSGTLFLDEIGELPLAAQVRLLRVLQEKQIERVGGQDTIHVDVRIVAATHRDLAAMVHERTFREDLWYRVNMFPILLPRLSERVEDIPALAKHFARKAAVSFGFLYVEPSPEQIDRLIEYHWPGNIRELQAVMDRAVILGRGIQLDIVTALGIGLAPKPRTVPISSEPTFYEVIPDVPAARTAVVPSPPLVVETSRMESLNDSIRRQIERALSASHGQIEGRRGAAAALQINPHTLRAKMRKLGIRWSEFRTD